MTEPHTQTSLTEPEESDEPSHKKEPLKCTVVDVKAAL